MTDNDIAKSIATLRTKLTRQENAVKSTKDLIEVLEKLITTQGKPAK